MYAYTVHSFDRSTAVT